MKIRNISYFEQHAEKIVLGVTGALLVGVAYFYLLGSPNSVTINNQTAEPAEVDRIIQREAERLAQLLDGGTPQELAEITVPSYLVDFEVRRNAPVMADSRLASSFSALPLFEGEDPLPGTRRPFHVPTIPQVPIVAARAEIGTLRETELHQSTRLTNLFRDRGRANSPDLAWVSLVGEFDIVSLVNELESYEDGETRRIPESWWTNSLGIVRVDVERRELLADGTWSSPEPVQELPGAITYADAAERMDATDADPILRSLQRDQLDIVQRPFYALVNRDWAPPVKGESGAVQIERITELREQIDTDTRRLEAAERRLQELERAAGARQTQPQPRPGATRGGPDDYGAVTGGTRQRPQTQNNAQQQQAQQMRQRVQQMAQSLYELEVEYAELTGQPAPRAPRRIQTAPTSGPGYPGDFTDYPTGPGGFGPGGGSAPISPYDYETMYQTGPQVGSPFGQPQIGVSGTRNDPRRAMRPSDMNQRLGVYRRTHFGTIPLAYVDDTALNIWAHDIHVEEGKVYSYRMRVAVVNPLFDRGSSMSEEQRAEQDDRFLIHSEWSDWSEPQEVERLKQFFFVSGSANPAPGFVTAEVWRFTRGEWFQREFRVVPGDPIGRLARVERQPQGRPQPRQQQRPEEVEIDFFTNAYVLDIDFEHALPGGGTFSRTTQRVTYAYDQAADAEALSTRVVEFDRDNTKRQLLQLEKELGRSLTSR